MGHEALYLGFVKVNLDSRGKIIFWRASSCNFSHFSTFFIAVAYKYLPFLRVSLLVAGTHCVPAESSHLSSSPSRPWTLAYFQNFMPSPAGTSRPVKAKKEHARPRSAPSLTSRFLRPQRTCRARNSHSSLVIVLGNVPVCWTDWEFAIIAPPAPLIFVPG